jgi:hypothetical protein
MKNNLLYLFFSLVMLMVSFALPQIALAGMPACEAECLKCADVCDKTAAQCKKQGGAHADAAHLKHLEDCAKLCRASADFMKRDSDLSSKVCALCQEACNKCAESCDTIKDKSMKDCAKECRKCATSCKSMGG